MNEGSGIRAAGLSRRTVVERDASAVAVRDASPRSEDDASRPTSADASTIATRRICAWCPRPIPERARRDAVCCSVRCRQARHRFLRAVGYAEAVGPDRPLRLAYADPPYPGKARLYRDHPDYGGEVDHAGLIERLADYDGWALSTSAEALPAVLALCPPGVRVAAWHRGERPTRSAWPLHAWEPVIYWGGRQLTRDAGDSRRVDSIVCGVAAVTTLPGRVIGAKPAAVCRWIFDLLGAGPGDSLDDLFPGSGAVGRAWAAFTDPSRRPRGDASAPGRRDASLAAMAYASRQVLGDASDQARADASRTGSRGFPLCGDCGGEGIGPRTPWCVAHWTPERDPEGAASARRLGLLADASFPDPGDASRPPVETTALEATS